MDIFNHHIYEYKKGLRNLVLFTSKNNKKNFIQRLEKEKISYLIHEFKDDKFNIYFGDDICIEIIKHLNKSNLNDFTKEEDFMLGIMLGYNRLKQCKRYLEQTKDMKVINL